MMRAFGRTLRTFLRTSVGAGARLGCRRLSQVFEPSDTTVVNGLRPEFDVKRDSFALLIPLEEYRQRQVKLVELVLKRIGENGSCLLMVPASRRSYQATTKIPSIHYKENAEFIYLTGLNTYQAAGSILVILGDPNQNRSILFAPHASRNQAVWEGLGLLSPEWTNWVGQVSDDLKDVDTVEKFVTENSPNRQLFVTSDKDSIPYLSSAKPLSPLIDELRVIKSDNELLAMKRTCAIGSKAMQKTISWSTERAAINSQEFNIPLVKESQIEAHFDYESRVNGAVKVAFPSVCAGAHRATAIHYGSNNMFVGKDDWVLMDAGCEDMEGYNSDITRCWPVGPGQSSAPNEKLRLELYEALCDVHQQLIAAINEKEMSLDSLFTLMCQLLGKLLIEFNVVPKCTSTNESARRAFRFCPHHVSHYLGLDVHDTPSISRSIPIQPGMCFTIEPGLYFREEDDVKKEFKGIGLRVEDDLCMLQDRKAIVLTSLCPQMPTKACNVN